MYRIKFNNGNECKNILKSIDETLMEIECIRNSFDNVSDPRLIEMAIYNEKAAKARYCYLISEAKRLGIRYGKNVG